MTQILRFCDHSYPQYADFDDGGPYNEPPRREPLMINVIVYDGSQLIRNHKKNYRNKKVRTWINDLILWAVKNGKRIEISKG